MADRVKIERMAYGADAIGHLEGGKTVFVAGGAPGDVAEVDVVEDAGVTAEQLEREFGPRVARIVAGESEDKREGRRAADTWKERKQEAVDHLSKGSWEELAVCLGDKLSNMRSFRREIDGRGDGLWESFNQKDPREHAWYYRSLAEAMRPALGDTAAWQEYHRLTEEVFSRYDG